MRALTLAIALGVAGCSFIAVRGPSGMAPVQCTEAPIAPIADSIATALLTTATIKTATSPCGFLGCRFVDFVAVLGGIEAAGAALSATYGYVEIHRCTVAKHEHLPTLQERLAELAAQATATARAGDCRHTAELMLRVGELDIAYRDQVIDREPVIVQCLLSPEAAGDLGER